MGKRADELRTLVDNINTSHTERAAFLDRTRQEVAAQRKEFQAENEAAHDAWFGKTSKKRK